MARECFQDKVVFDAALTVSGESTQEDPILMQLSKCNAVKRTSQKLKWLALILHFTCNRMVPFI
jgi:hypothetical protein